MLLAVVVSLSLGAFEPDALLPGKPYALRAHTDGISAVAFSPDGKTVASASRDLTIKLWSLETGELLKSIPGGEMQINALAFSPDGKWLASGEAGLRARIVEVASGTVTRTIPHPANVSDLSWSPDGKSIAVVSMQGAGAVYEVSTGKQVKPLDARSVRWSADGKTLVLGLSTEVVWLDAKTFKPRKTVNLDKPSPFVVSAADGSVVASWSLNSTDVKLWNEKGAIKTLSLALPEDAPRVRNTHVALTDDGKQVLTLSSDGRARVWNVADAKVTAMFPAEKLVGVVVSPNAKWLAVTGSSTLLLWKLP